MSNNKPESRLIRAAGAVAWRPGRDGEPEILLVHRKKYDDWSLPKGKTEPGEPLPVTAIREVLEEGGASLALGRRLASVRYNVGGRPKRVHYWAARVTSTDDHAVPNSEVDLIDWVPATRAAGHVSYDHDQPILADFARLPVHTVPLILLRHAKAVGKADWKRGDVRRPLDDSGRADAESLADLLSCFAPHAGSAPRPRLISSPAVRCLDTLRPFAELTGARLREEPSLYLHNPSSGTGRADSAPSIADLVTEAITSGEPTVFCAHRENISDLQAAVLAALPAEPPPLDGILPKGWEDALPAGGFWVLNLAPAPAQPPAATWLAAPVPPPSATAESPAPAPAPAPAAPAPAAKASPFAALRRWLRTRGRPSRHTLPSTRLTQPGTGTAAPSTADPSAAGTATADPGADSPGKPGTAPHQTAQLISADRYDLSDD